MTDKLNHKIGRIYIQAIPKAMHKFRDCRKENSSNNEKIEKDTVVFGLQMLNLEHYHGISITEARDIIKEQKEICQYLEDYCTDILKG